MWNLESHQTVPTILFQEILSSKSNAPSHVWSFYCMWSLHHPTTNFLWLPFWYNFTKPCISDHGPDRPVAFFCYIDSHVFQFCYTIQTNDNSKKGVIKLPFSCTPSEDKVMIEWGLPVSLLALAIYWSEVVDHRCKTCCYIEEGSTGVEQWCARWWYDSIHNLVVLQMTYHDLTTYLNREKSVTEEIKPILQSLKLILLIKPW